MSPPRPSDDKPARTERQAWTTVAVLLVLYAFSMMDRQVLYLLVEPIKKDLQVTDFQISLLQGAAFAIFYAICGLPLGWAVDRFSRRWIVFGGIVFWSFATAAGGFARNFWQLALSRMGVGVGEATLMPAAYSMLSDLFPKERLTVPNAVFNLGSIVGAALSFALGGILAGLAVASAAQDGRVLGLHPWQLVMFAVGLPGLLASGLVLLIHEPVRRGKAVVSVAGQDRPAAGSVFRFMRTHWRFYLSHFMGFSLLNLMTAASNAWMPSFLIRTYHWPVAKVGLTWASLAISIGTVSMLTSGYVADFLFRRGVRDAHMRYYVVAAVVLGVSGVAATTTHDQAVMMVCWGVFMFAMMIGPVAGTTLQLTTPNQYRGQVSALFLLCFNVIGACLGPSVVAGISDFALGGRNSIGAAMAITYAIVAPLAMLAFCFGLKPMRRAVEAAEAT